MLLVPPQSTLTTISYTVITSVNNVTAANLCKMFCARHIHANIKSDNQNAGYMHIKTNDHNYINTKPMNYSRMETPKHARIALARNASTNRKSSANTLQTSMKCQQIHKQIIRTVCTNCAYKMDATTSNKTMQIATLDRLRWL